MVVALSPGDKKVRAGHVRVAGQRAVRVGNEDVEPGGAEMRRQEASHPSRPASWIHSMSATSPSGVSLNITIFSMYSNVISYLSPFSGLWAIPAAAAIRRRIAS